MRVVAGKIMLKSGKLVDGFTADECDRWLAKQGWIRVADKWIGPGGIEIITLTLTEEELASHPCSFENMAINS